jgi:hypothetical protein
MIGRRERLVLLTAVVGMLAAGARPASAQNRLTNPGFDGNANGWNVFSVYDGTVDINNSASSGSAALFVTINTVGDSSGIVAQCVTPVTPGAPLTYTGHVMFTAPTSPNPGSGAGLMAFQGASDAGCTIPTGPVSESVFPGQTNGIWQTNSFSATVPAGAHSIFIAIGVRATTTAGDFLVHADNLDFETAAAVPTMSTVWLTLLAVGCALAVLVMQQRRVRIART